ncbi:arylesterase, partial [Halieaceae bacterium]|nr:arylesterase [Halieaceae bacterium]
MLHILFRVLRTPLVLGSLLLSLSAAGNAQQPAILVLGDSISAAYGMSLDQGWVALLERRLASSHPDYQVVNASISGETSGGGLRRLPQLLQAHQPSLVIIELGGNDGLRGYPLDKFRENLTQMARLSQEAGAEVMFLAMEIPPQLRHPLHQRFSRVVQYRRRRHRQPSRRISTAGR